MPNLSSSSTSSINAQTTTPPPSRYDLGWLIILSPAVALTLMQWHFNGITAHLHVYFSPMWFSLVYLITRRDQIQVQLAKQPGETAVEEKEQHFELDNVTSTFTIQDLLLMQSFYSQQPLQQPRLDYPVNNQRQWTVNGHLMAADFSYCKQQACQLWTFGWWLIGINYCNEWLAFTVDFMPLII